jgi:hypothetical protein
MGHKLNNLLFSFLILIALCGAETLCAQNAQGTNIRGQVQFLSSASGKEEALSNATIDLYYAASPGNYTFVNQTVTNGFGFFYLYGINPGNGDFFIQVNKSKNYQIRVNPQAFSNGVYNKTEFQDLPVLHY